MKQTYRLLSIRLLLLSFATICISCFLVLFLGDSQGVDFYPIWLGAKAVLSSISPYSPIISSNLDQVWQSAVTGKAVPVVAYPLPFLLLLTPLALLPLSLALMLWIFLCLMFLAVVLPDYYKDKKSWPLALLFFPLFHVLLLKNASLLWLGLSILLLLMLRKDNLRVSAFLICLLALKPQAGLVFSIYGLFEVYRRHKLACLGPLFFWFICLWGVSFAIQPNWLFEWWQAVSEYSAHTKRYYLLPLGLALPLASYKLSKEAIIACLQVVLFPVNDLYSTLPLLIAWVSLGGPIALVGCGFSWLIPLVYEHPNNLESMWLLVLIPYALCAAFSNIKNQRGRNAAQKVV